MPTSSEKAVSRRQYLRAVGGGAGAAGIAGCMGGNDDGNGGNGGDPDVQEHDPEGEEVTIEMDLGTSVREHADEVEGWLRDAGLPDNINVDILSVSEISDDVQVQFREWLSAGRDRPDILRMDSGWTIPFIQRGQILNLSEHMSSEAIDRVRNDYFEASVMTATDDNDDIFGIPFQVGFPTMLYRKDLVEQAGYDPEGEEWATNPLSWEEFSHIVADTMDEAGDEIQYGVATQMDNYEGLACCTFNEYMSSWGGAFFGGRENLFGPVGDRPVTVEEEPVLNALRMVRAMVHGEDDEHALDGYAQVVPETALQWTEGPSISAFEDGNAVALRYWPTAIVTQGQKWGDDLGVMPMPYGAPAEDSEYEDVGGSMAALGGWHLTVNPHSERIGAALEVMEAMMDPNVRRNLMASAGTIPPEPGLLEPSELEEHSPEFAAHAEAFQFAGDTAIPRPVSLAWPEQSPIISQEVNATLAGQKSPEDAMADLQESLEALEEDIGGN